jgi:hypothetical protein
MRPGCGFAASQSAAATGVDRSPGRDAAPGSTDRRTGGKARTTATSSATATVPLNAGASRSVAADLGGRSRARAHSAIGSASPNQTLARTTHSASPASNAIRTICSMARPGALARASVSASTPIAASSSAPAGSRRLAGAHTVTKPVTVGLVESSAA